MENVTQNVIKQKKGCDGTCLDKGRKIEHKNKRAATFHCLGADMSSRFTSSSIERYNDFSRLNPAIVGWHVHVKVLRRFHTDDYISKGGLGLLLVDDKGNQIEALICSPLTFHYSTFIEEDEFYAIMNFRVVENSGFTKLTRSDFKIMFYDGTIVKEASSFSQDDYIVATPFGAIFNGYHDTSYLITLIGRVVESSDLTNVTDEPSVIGGYRYSFTIEDQEKKTLKCCAYGGVAIECHDRFRNVIGTDVTCVLRWWKVYQLLDGWRHVRIYSHPPYSKILVQSDADNHVEASAAVLSLDEFKDVLSDLGALSADKDYVLAVLYLRFVAAGMKPYPSDGLECDEILMNTNEDTLECINDIVISSWRLCPAYLRLRFVESLILYKSINVHTVWDACYRVLSGDVLAEQKIARNNPVAGLSYRRIRLQPPHASSFQIYPTVSLFTLWQLRFLLSRHTVHRPSMWSGSHWVCGGLGLLTCGGSVAA
ncbi:hypothetical protein ARALYDRAFT_894114 [Arabidopsis lyrata subsp. lyrata]|uniref:Replication protein A 70 kDa DNA-binding subunit B/D first OB fold domain-containing protein n=1 Tax=Arabidopsis lyrata subsp. lyrata TaxID=81972 RepID=D7KRY0_ARALL|nr:hypothetical protein ARALYDRAFT_894114 [Arabidopsis lyrata subsp. lyrata]